MLCICRYRHLSSTCALWRVGGSHRAVRSAGRNSRTAGRGGLQTTSPCHHLNARRWSRVFDFGSGEISRPRYGYLSRYAVASTRRVAASTPTGGSGCGAAGRGRAGGRRSRGAARNEEAKYVFFTHLSHTEVRTGNSFRQPRTVSALVGTLSSAKSEELRARAITNLPKSSEYRRAGTGMWERVGRPVPVF